MNLPGRRVCRTMRVIALAILLAAAPAVAQPAKPIEGMADVVMDLSRAVMNLGAGPYSRALIFEPDPNFTDARPYGQGGMVIKPPDVDRDMVMGRTTLGMAISEVLGRLLVPWLWRPS
jgi:hypothetical protein